MTAAHALRDSHASINASLDDFEARDFSPTVPDVPSPHSGFRSNNASEFSEPASNRRSYSPPAWRKAGSGWFQHAPSLSPTRGGSASKDNSPAFLSADDDDDDGGDGGISAYRTATRIPLPESPQKGRSPSNSPEAEGQDVSEREKGGGPPSSSSSSSPSSPSSPSPIDEQHAPEKEPAGAPQPIEQSNYIRFTSSIAVQQRTDAIESAVYYVHKAVQHVSKSRYNAFVYAISTLVLYWLCASLLTTPMVGPVPDLIKVAGLAKSFEPVIHYSESGHEQIGELQETGVAVWDLGESVRNSNMTSAPVIVGQLETLSDSLKTLSSELTSFFAGLDSDVDAILLVMEWAGRELTALSHAPAASTLSSVWSNAHSLLTRAGLVSGESGLVRELVGATVQQRTRATLERAFTEFLNVMEESISNEMAYTQQLFGLFEAIDGQFLNLHRTVIREQTAQERIESDVLSSLWTRLVGADAGVLRKYEKNRGLLQSVRDRTVRNKGVLQEHNQRLQGMRSALDLLRRKLVSPLVRNTNSSSLSVEEQIRGLEGTYNHLRGVREEQKQKKMALMYGARQVRDRLQMGSGMRPGVDGYGYGDVP